MMRHSSIYFCLFFAGTLYLKMINCFPVRVRLIQHGTILVLIFLTADLASIPVLTGCGSEVYLKSDMIPFAARNVLG